MGWRALRLALERDGLLKVQARALMEAAAGRTLHVMFPMISEPWELMEAKMLFQRQHDWLAQHGRKLPRAIRYGAMLEVPALAETLDFVLPELDFLSIGTNDLTQFLFAADRANPKLALRYDWMGVAILRFISRVVKACEGHDVTLGVCGEMGGRTLEAMALLGIGISRLSITPASVGPVKAMIRSLDLAALRAYCGDLVQSGTQNLREPLTQWASAHNVEIN